MSWRTGWRALAHSRRTVPGVSSPCKVVRSMQVTARSSHAACQAFLTLRRVGKVAARRSVALRLVKRASWTQSRSSGSPGLRASAAGSGACPLAGAAGETLTLERAISRSIALSCDADAGNQTGLAIRMYWQEAGWPPLGRVLVAVA